MEFYLFRHRLLAFFQALAVAMAFGATASEKVDFDLTDSSSRVIAAVLDAKADPESSKCSASVLRPLSREADIESTQHRLTCVSRTSSQVELLEIVRAWGTTYERKSFQVGSAWSKIFWSKLDAPFNFGGRYSADDRLSIIVLCDPTGIECTETRFIHEFKDRDSAAAIACRRLTVQVPGLHQRYIPAPRTGTAEDDASDSLVDMIHGQIEQSQRTAEYDCVFIAPAAEN